MARRSGTASPGERTCELTKASLDRSLAVAAAVINCAGPFLETADAVSAAALRARIHYLDVTAEQLS